MACFRKRTRERKTQHASHDRAKRVQPFVTALRCAKLAQCSPSTFSTSAQGRQSRDGFLSQMRRYCVRRPLQMYVALVTLKYRNHKYSLYTGGGLAVRASVDFSQTASQAAQPDLWSRTYVRSTTQNPSPLRERSTTLPASTPRPFSEAPNLTRPRSTYLSRSTLGDPIMSHIESALARDSHDSVTAGISKKDDVFDTSSHDDILLDPNTSTLAKAYGSVLQPKESLSFFTCIVCSSPFPPDATIYPDPNEPATTTRFLCKPCFIKNGGAKGDCASCGRPILILTSEGGFIENAGRLWHKRCFRCDGCFKDTSDRPMVDLLGRPSCEDCFDTCLKRPRSDSIGSKRASISTPDKEDIRSNPGGMKRGTSRDGSPAIEELQQRLGIKSRESSPLIERKTVKITDRETSPIVPDLAQRMSDLSLKASQVPDSRDSCVEDSPSKTSNASPRGRYARFRLSSMSASSKPITIHSPSPRAENNTVDDMERRLLRRSLTGSPSTTSHSPTRPSRDSLGGVSFTPDLTDSSSSVSTFSPPSTPSNSPPVQLGTTPDRTPTKPQLNQFDESPTKLILSSPSTPCAKCSKPLFRTRGGGKFVTVPEESSKRLPPKSYHVECFRCAVCEDPFEETKSGQAIFIRTSTGCCHVNVSISILSLLVKLSDFSSSAQLQNASLSALLRRSQLPCLQLPRPRNTISHQPQRHRP